MPLHSVVLINHLKVEPGKQDELLSLLKRNIETVVSTLDGWKGSRLMASEDGGSVVIYSEWETPAGVEAMRSDPRMTAYFPHIRALASFDSILGTVAFERTAGDAAIGLDA
jgi:quinol monooxygenase YgiN